MKKPPRSAILRENFHDMPPQNPSSMKQNRSSNRKQKHSKENAPPSNINAIPDSSPNPSFTGKPSPSVVSKLKSLLPPRPPSSNPLKRKIGTDFQPENGVAGSSDTGVKVIVRMRPLSKNEEGEMIVQKTSGDSLSILGQQFTFDHVADTSANQMDIFQLVGAPLVENCLAGFNSSIFAYGQTGSGKTFTIWGPTNALLEENSSSDDQGLTPRVFERLFSRINEEQDKHADKQLMYQCRCSFLEIYNEQITDLLNPSQKNLHLREDTKTGVYVENLTESTICSMNDVTQLLKKGLSNRRTGATSINIESSRSHSVFTCVVESRCKSLDGLSCFKTSRMNLVDLAGSERQKSTGAAGDRLKEAGNINRSLSQLGNLINILAEVSQTGKQRHIPYRDSKLTFLLQESLGGNAKLAMLCAISPSQCCRSETYSTLRFAQRAKDIKNKAVVNEQMQDNVNTLREVIRQLRDELVRVKASGNKGEKESAGGYSTGWNARRSLCLLKYSLNNCPMVLPRVDDDGDEEMEIVDEIQENKKTDPKDSKDITDVKMEEVRNLEANVDNQDSVLTEIPSDLKIVQSTETNVGNQDYVLTEIPSDLKSPIPSVSPINNSRKSLRTSTMLTASQKEQLTETRVSEVLENHSPKPSKSLNNNLAFSLHRGLEVINKNRKSCYKSLDCKPKLVRKDIGVQTIDENKLEEEKEIFCKTCNCTSSKDGNLQLVPVDGGSGSQLADKSNKKLVPKAVEKVLAGAIRREMALEELCTRQHSEINQLNRLLQQYKHERECNLIIGEIREDKIARLESLMDGILTPEEFKDDELTSLKNENKILKENYKNNPEVLRTKIEFQRVQDELERYQNFFELGEKDILLEEIQDLRNQLQSYIDSSSKPIFQLTYPSNSDLEAIKQELETTRLLVEKQKQELNTERKCSKELKDAMQMAMEGHARMLEQYADLEEKHIHLLTTQRRIEDGVSDIKKAALKAGIKGAECRFINALANEYSTLKAEREKERHLYRDENKGLQEQLKDTTEAVQAAGELLVRLKEAEDAVACAEARAREAEEEKERANKEIENLKRKYEDGEMTKLPPRSEENDGNDQQWEGEFEKFYTEDEELTKLSEPSSWFSGYDKCNI